MLFSPFFPPVSFQIPVDEVNVAGTSREKNGRTHTRKQPILSAVTYMEHVVKPGSVSDSCFFFSVSTWWGTAEHCGMCSLKVPSIPQSLTS